MKKMLTVAYAGHFFTQTARTCAVFVILALGFGFWTAMTPIAKAREMTPTEMIESKLPEGKTLVTAAKPELLSAVCAAVKQWREAAARIVKTAVEAHQPWGKDIVATAIRCLPGQINCDMIVAIASAAVATDPDDAADIVEMIIHLYPECRAIIERDLKGDVIPPIEDVKTGADIDDFPPNVNPPPGSIVGGRGGGPEETLTVCDNGLNVQVPRSLLDDYLATHPGSSVGACQPTPVTNT